MLDVDGLPHHRLFGGIETGVEKLIVQRLIGPQELRQLGHHRMIVGNHAEKLAGLLEQRTALFRSSHLVVKDKLDHRQASWFANWCRAFHY